MVDVDPTSDIAEDIGADEAPTCAVTGEPILDEEAHRVLTWVEDGEVHTKHFGSPAARDEWLDEHGQPPY
jgi:hypothetical protein